jgi:putative ABC transport system permease protein
MLLLPGITPHSPLSIRVDPQHPDAILAATKTKYLSFFPGNVFDFYFLDERFNRQYRDEQLFGKVFSIFAVFAIFVACLGVLGLSLFATAQRTKEIGVRKVLGASAANIIGRSCRHGRYPHRHQLSDA